MPGSTSASRGKHADPNQSGQQYAHSLPDSSSEKDWEPLPAHLEEVAARAASLGANPWLAAWARLAGLWHDAGKADPQFQRYIRGNAGDGGDHAIVGAVLAAELPNNVGLPLAFAIAGHHTGLANLQRNTQAQAQGIQVESTPLMERVRVHLERTRQLKAWLPDCCRIGDVPSLPHWLDPDLVKCRQIYVPVYRRRLALFTRLLFSTLVDADRLATARFYAQHEPALLHDDLVYDDLQALRDRLDAHIDGVSADAQRKRPGAMVNELRQQVLDACRRAAELEPGRFALTVPTGGGKTLAAMSMALRHAVRYGMQRVIVVIPFTSIIEQNAERYREALFPVNVLEHHSNLDELRLDRDDSQQEARRKLAAENWDSPIVVTTAVQFFESLFTSHPSRARKVHRIARSVIILDEVQTLPPRLLQPILDALRELTDHYGCSIILSTATPPALARSETQPWGLSSVRQVIPNPQAMADRARRVTISWQIDQPTPYDELARQLVEHDRVLAIVHLRRDARELAQAVERITGDTAGLFHLSALMCPAHRAKVLADVTHALEKNKTCRLIATQLVEAGVDVDFPVVYRALAGVDSLAQAAGRCDREGKLTEANGGAPSGRMIVFRAPTQPPPGLLRKALESTQRLITQAIDPKDRGQLDLFNPDTSIAFFQDLYGKIDPDDANVQSALERLDLATASELFRMIDSDSRAIVVPYGEAAARLDEFRANPSRQTQRALQPYLVQVSPTHYAALAAGALERIHDRVDALTDLFADRYHDRFGLDPTIDGVVNPEVLMQ